MKLISTPTRPTDRLTRCTSQCSCKEIAAQRIGAEQKDHAAFLRQEEMGFHREKTPEPVGFSFLEKANAVNA